MEPRWDYDDPEIYEREYAMHMDYSFGEDFDYLGVVAFDSVANLHRFLTLVDGKCNLSWRDDNDFEDLWGPTSIMPGDTRDKHDKMALYITRKYSLMWDSASTFYTDHDYMIAGATGDYSFYWSYVGRWHVFTAEEIVKSFCDVSTERDGETLAASIDELIIDPCNGGRPIMDDSCCEQIAYVLAGF